MPHRKSKVSRQRCFFDVSIGGEPAGRIIIELFNDIVPKTCENFRGLCTGEYGEGRHIRKPLHYKGVIFHRIIRTFMVQSGDIESGDGTGGESIYGPLFDDENFKIMHDKPLLVSMANRGPNTNSSQFFITTAAAPHLDGVHVCFGHVISGQDVVTQLEKEETDDNNTPLRELKIVNCGQLVPKHDIIKKRKKKHHKKSDEDTSTSSSESEPESKHKRSKRRQRSSSIDSVPAVEDVSVRAEEIPEVPMNRFLMRGGPQVVPEERHSNSTVSRGRRPFTSKSGRKVRGRGFLRFRTPSRSDDEDRETTPPHWRDAERRGARLSKGPIWGPEENESNADTASKQTDERNEYRSNRPFKREDRERNTREGDRKSSEYGGGGGRHSRGRRERSRSPQNKQTPRSEVRRRHSSGTRRRGRDDSKDSNSGGRRRRSRSSSPQSHRDDKQRNASPRDRSRSRSRRSPPAGGRDRRSRSSSRHRRNKRSSDTQRRDHSSTRKD